MITSPRKSGSLTLFLQGSNQRSDLVFLPSLSVVRKELVPPATQKLLWNRVFVCHMQTFVGGSRAH